MLKNSTKPIFKSEVGPIPSIFIELSLIKTDQNVAQMAGAPDGQALNLGFESYPFLGQKKQRNGKKKAAILIINTFQAEKFYMQHKTIAFL
jgi:hypothetical protein